MSKSGRRLSNNPRIKSDWSRVRGTNTDRSVPKYIVFDDFIRLLGIFFGPIYKRRSSENSSFGKMQSVMIVFQSVEYSYKIRFYG